jgi:pimeloyl-ACP methyl ester carboxylesterase
MEKVSVIFVHGFLGDPIATWGSIGKFLAADEELKGFCKPDFFRYPAGLAAWVPWLTKVPFIKDLPFVRQAIKIQDAALGLGTYIDAIHGEQTPLVLIGHSMGGLIVREYVLNQVTEDLSHRIRKVLLFAVPNKGANLAALGEKFGFSSRQIQQLSPDSDYLENLNRRWLEHQVDDRVHVGCVAPLLDQVVPKASALLSADRSRSHYLHEDDHLSCVKPSTIDALSYQLIRAAIVKASQTAAVPYAEAPDSRGDPLFYLYDAQCEPYYIQRATDEVIAKLVDTGVWVYGVSGVGKTNCLLRNAIMRHHRTAYVSVASLLGGASTSEISRSLAAQIVRRACGDGFALPGSEQDIAGWLLSSLQSRLGKSLPLTVIIDELVDDQAVMLAVVRLTMSVIQAQRMAGKIIVRFAYGSLLSPAHLMPDAEQRLLEAIRPVEMLKWASSDIGRLVDRLCHGISVPVAPSDRERIVRDADGDPRFVKNVFRELGASVEGAPAFDTALMAVKAERVRTER